MRSSSTYKLDNQRVLPGYNRKAQWNILYFISVAVPQRPTVFYSPMVYHSAPGTGEVDGEGETGVTLEYSTYYRLPYSVPQCPIVLHLLWITLQCLTVSHSAPQCPILPQSAPQFPIVSHSIPYFPVVPHSASQCPIVPNSAPIVPHSAPQCLIVSHDAPQCLIVPQSSPQSGIVSYSASTAAKVSG